MGGVCSSVYVMHVLVADDSASGKGGEISLACFWLGWIGSRSSYAGERAVRGGASGERWGLDGWVFRAYGIVD